MLCVLAVGYLLAASPRETSATVRATAPVLRHRPIDEIRLGQRAVGVNPLRNQTHAASNITPATWRVVDLVTDFHGVDYEFSLLRPLEWIDAKQAIVGGDIQLDVEELGICGAATVTSIGPCQEIEPDRPNQRRNVVTGLIRHPADNILYLSVEGESEPIGATTLHPFWSEDRHGFVAAGELLTGERFRTVTGATARLTSVIHHSGPAEMVYNLEVDAEHVFCVGNSGLLSHNAKECGGRPSVNSRLPDRVTQELPPGLMRSPTENAQARNFFKRNREEAMNWYKQRTGFDWDPRSTHAEHPRPIKNGGDPLFVVPGYGGPTAPHMVIGEDGPTDFQRWGKLGGRPGH